MMNSCFRHEPNFDTEEAYAAIKMWAVSAIGVALLLYAIWKGMENIDLSWIIQTLCLVPLVVILMGIGVKMFLDGISILVKKGNWMRGTTSAQARIVDREELFVDGGYYESGRCTYSLTFETSHVQAIASSDQQTIKASVSKRIYDRYARRDIARIYYSVADPFMFLIDGE
jgi:hypothetical protein